MDPNPNPNPNPHPNQVPRPLDLYAIAAHALDEVSGSNYRIGAGTRLTLALTLVLRPG